MKLTLIPAQYLEQSIQYPELSLCRIVSQEKGLPHHKRRRGSAGVGIR